MPSVAVPPSLRFFSTRRILRQISANAIFWAPARLNRHSGLDTAWQVQ
jgi:hypothetical protein